MDYLRFLTTVPMPFSITNAADIKRARDLVEQGYVEARFVSPSRGRYDPGAELGAVVIRITPAGFAALA